MPNSSRARQRAIHLDPRAPLVIDTHELHRRPGSMRPVVRSVPAPADLGVAMVRVPKGSDLDLDLRLESVLEGVLVSGSVEAHYTGECVRCLTDVEGEVVADVQELFAYPESDAEEDEALRLDGDLLDLEPTVRDALVLTLPLQPVCSEDCEGLCPDCGARLADDPDHTHEVLDDRWAALRGLAAPGTGDRPVPRPGPAAPGTAAGPRSDRTKASAARRADEER